MSLISFSCASPLASWSPTVNPAKGGGYSQNEEHYQPQAYAGADLYVYDHGHIHGRLLTWEALPKADMITLLAFINLMHGGVHTFTFTDYESTSYTGCRILNYQDFQFKNLTLELFQVALEIEVP